MPWGSLEVITGPMFSRKTEELLWRLEQVRLAGRKALLFKPVIDTRYAKDAVVTHDGREVKAYLLQPGEESLAKLEEIAGAEALHEAAVVAFDEGNFFSERLPALCEELVALGKRVIVAGLDLTYAGKPFGPMPTLLALADKVEKRTAICTRCGGFATRTQRLIDGKPAPLDDPVIKVGGAESYAPRCRQCYAEERGSARTGE
ncbi:MAG: thymidine kinase [Candidatus Bipolaricaulia bacterium]